MRNNFVKTLLENAKNDKNIVLMTGDLGFGVLDVFQKTLPEQFINAGISEQNMISMAAGMALSGKKVFVYSIGNFPTLRPLEQIRNDVCYHNADVKIVTIGGGFAYGSLGMSHHATEDISIMRSLPNMQVLTPGDITETIAATKYACSNNCPTYIRLGKGGEPKLHDEKCDYESGKAVLINEGSNKKTVVFVCGSISEEAIKANDMLKQKRFEPVNIYSFISVKPIDEKLIVDCATRYEKIITVEEHNIIGGFGGAVAEVLSGIRHNSILKRIGLQDTYSSIVGNQRYLRIRYEMDAAAIAQEIVCE